MRTSFYHVFTQERLYGARWHHETAHRDLADAQGDAREYREGYMNARTKIIRGPDTFEWASAKMNELNAS
jgi:hypothetical protein